MKIRKPFIISILLAGLFSSASGVFSQSDNLKYKRNFVEFFKGYFFAFEVKPYSPFPKGGEPDFCFGLDYLRLMGKKNWAAEISGSYWGSSYNGRNTWMNPGEIDEISSAYLALAIHRPLVQKKHILWFASTGLCFRGGSESMVILHHLTAGGWPEVISMEKIQRDIGLSIGSRISWLPIKHISLSGELRFMRFIYRYDSGNSNYSFDKGSTKNLLALQLKLGFCF